MNDPGFDGRIEETLNEVSHTLNNQVSQDSLQSFRPKGKRKDKGFLQPTRWWFTSTAFPLIAGTFGPLANLFSVCALVQTWRVRIPDGGVETQGARVEDPHWLLALNSVSLALSLAANLLLLLNFARRVRYSIAQPLTIVLWYMASALLIVPLGLTKDLVIHPRVNYAFAQSYYYGLISAAIYVIISSLLLWNVLGAYLFKAYSPSFSSLTIPQRTLMLQTISYILYLALGAGIFSKAEGWEYLDGLYWADYTLLTIGLGSDFPLRTTLARALLIPYTAGGIMMIGLVIGSIRGLVLERGKIRVVRRTLGKQRQQYIEDMHRPDHGWKRREFETMRRIEHNAEKMQKYSSLGTSFFAFIVLWLGGALVFWFSEKKPQSWTYFEALYFTYTTLLTIGYGDFYPQSNSGKPFFVIWSLIAVPTVTVLISNMGDTLIGWLKEGTLWIGQRTILPERRDHNRYSSNGQGLRRDVEKLGDAVEQAEEKHGRGGGLAARIAKEITEVAKDVGKKPPKKYEWEEWTKWLALIGLKDQGGSRGDLVSSRGDSGQVGWTWLGDDGPLLSDMTETEWILEKLCIRLGEVLEQEQTEIQRKME